VPWEGGGVGLDLSGLDLGGEEVGREREREGEYIASFIACGDLSAWDSDATYQLEGERVVLEPIQQPTAPPYKTALEMRRVLAGEGKGRDREVRREKKGRAKKKEEEESEKGIVGEEGV